MHSVRGLPWQTSYFELARRQKENIAYQASLEIADIVRYLKFEPHT